MSKHIKETISTQFSENHLKHIHEYTPEPGYMFFRTPDHDCESVLETCKQIRKYLTENDVLPIVKALEMSILVNIPEYGICSNYGWDKSDTLEFCIMNAHQCPECEDRPYWVLIGPVPHPIRCY